jgi:hypothetical protein
MLVVLDLQRLKWRLGKRKSGSKLRTPNAVIYEVNYTTN